MPLTILIGLALVLMPSAVSASEKFALQSDVDHVWTMTAAGLVFFMQAGFMLLEAGTVRAKNSVNVAQKNLIDFLFSTVCYGAIGFSLMFGATQGGWFGWSSEIAFFNSGDNWSMTFFVFQLVFCGTAATIVSGAVAERMTMPGYILTTVLIAVLIYPVVGHWVWGGLLNGQEGPWLADMGFMDFAGGTVVHSVGAWVGLAAIIVIGARRGKFDENGNPVVLHGHSPILATAGLVIIWVGWIGFNGGSTTAGTGDFAKIVQNTMICAGVAGSAAMLLGWWLSGYLTPSYASNGVLAGLVAVTPGCDVLSGQGAMVLGVLAGGLAILSERIFERVFRLDDPLGAVSVHGVCGAFGTIMLAVLAPQEALLTDDRLAQIWVQLIGVACVFVWTFGIAFAVLWTVSKVFSPGGGRSGLRVLEEHEVVGLNVAEHNAPLGTGVLHAALLEIANNHEKDFEPITVERGDEAYEMAEVINQIMGALHDALSEMEHAVAGAAEGDFSHRIALDRFSGTPLRLCHGMNRINESCDHGLRSIQSRLEKLADGDLISPITGTLKGQFAALSETLEASTARLSETLADIALSATRADTCGHHIAEASQTLAGFGQDQQTSLASAMPIIEDVRQHSNDDSQRAREAASHCAHALALAEEGVDVVNQALTQMTDVTAASANIDKAVDQIETIARQINLLAVNSGVEAARVGTSGNESSSHGFNLLAQEVRNLADHTHETVNKVREKSAIVASTTECTNLMINGLRDTLGEMHSTMQGTSTLSKEVADAGILQQERLTDVSNAVQNVQQNSSKTLRLIHDTKSQATIMAQDAQLTARKLSEFKLESGPQAKAA